MFKTFLFLLLFFSFPVRAQYTVYAKGNLAQMKTAPDKKLRQTGKKVFLPSDEGKVGKIKVPTPDFDRLSPAEKQDVLQRIQYKEIK